MSRVHLVHFCIERLAAGYRARIEKLGTSVDNSLLR